MLAVIPARGGSRGIPNKNVRLLHGRPLLTHIADTLRAVPDVTHIVVSTDAPDIAAVARLHGFPVVNRPAELATDEVPVAEVLAHVARVLSWEGPAGLFQPTVPCLSAETIWAGIREFRNGYDSLGFVTREHHLLWDEQGPLYQARVNRQFGTGYDRELGAFLTRDARVLIGERHCRFPVPAHEAIDIDTPADWETASHLLGRKTIEFRAAASEQIGTGHIRRCVQLAEELAHHDVMFPAQVSWPVWAKEEVARWDGRSVPDLVVFDKLDTTRREVAEVQAQGIPVVSLEDLGEGAQYADLVVNELYRDREWGHVVTGPEWAVLRPEFCGLPEFRVRDDAENVLVVFGGTDPAGLTGPVSRWLSPAANVKNLAPGVSVAEAMRTSDLVVCSAGRMAHEAAAVGVPCITIAVNERESRHSHCPGILRLGLWASLGEHTIVDTVRKVLGSPGLRGEMSRTARAAVDGKGAQRIAHRIDGILAGL